ncbi:MAG: response regulator transcription factor, partial [Prevotellaceae bacterium]|nr:response regulator transcription factor [Prevotellaceae bacterium]
MVILADRQDITRAGFQYVLTDMFPGIELHYSEDKASLIERLKQSDFRPSNEAIVVLDYTQFDFINDSELSIVAARFPHSRWILFSEELSVDLVRRVIGAGAQFSVLLKESPMNEIRECIKYAVNDHRYICQRMTELLFAPQQHVEQELVTLTKTETEILRDIALGLTTKEIAEKRFSSFHTVNTHRKNIFRKLSVNNVHEATRYALRAGIVDEAEY